MKKAKIVMTAIGLFAVVGGALAFKAKRLQKNVYCSTVVSGQLTCNKLADYRTAIVIGATPTTTPCTFAGNAVKTYYTNTTSCPIVSGTVYPTTND